MRRILLRACGERFSDLRELSEISWGESGPNCAAKPPGHGLDYFLKNDGSVLRFEHIKEFHNTINPYVYTAILWVACAENNRAFLEELWDTRGLYIRDETKLSKLIGACSRCEFDMAQ
jgi:ribosomal protein L24E